MNHVLRFSAACALGLAAWSCDREPDPCVVDETPLHYELRACAAGAHPKVLGSFSGPGSKPSDEWATSRREVVLDESHAYWSDYDGRILRTPKVGGATEMLLEPSECSVAALAVDEVAVYFGHNCPMPGLEKSGPFLIEGKVGWIDKTTGERHDLAQRRFAEVTQLLVRDGVVHWIFRDPREFSQEVVLHAASREASSTDEAERLVASGAVYMFFGLVPLGIVWFDAASDALMWTQRDDLVAGGPFGRTLVPAPDAQYLIMQADRAFWVQRGTTPAHEPEWYLWRVPLGDADAGLVFEHRVTEHVATDGTHFYGAGHDDTGGSIVDRVYRWSPPDFAPVPLAAALTGPQSIALDDRYLFVVDRDWASERVSVRLIRIDR